MRNERIRLCEALNLTQQMLSKSVVLSLLKSEERITHMAREMKRNTLK